LYGCGSIREEERGLSVFNSRVLRNIYRSKRREITGEIWAVQVITFIYGQGSLYMME
jgi:hypothetical protein